MPNMPTWLKNLAMSKVDLVDRPADEHATVKFFKNDENPLVPEGTILKSDDAVADEVAMLGISKREFSSEQREKLAEEGKALPDGSFPIVNKTDLKNAVQAFGRASDKSKAKSHIIKRAKALNATDLLPENWKVSKSEQEGEMPELDEEVLKGLPDEVLSYIGHLEEEVTKASDENAKESEEEEQEDPVAKMEDLDLPENVLEELRKRDEEIEELRKSAKDSAAIAKAERDLRVTREWRDKVEGLNAITFDDTDAVVKSLKELADTNPDLANSTFETLKAANGQAESAEIFTEIGKGAPAEGSAEAKLEKVVKSIQESEDVSEPEAWDLAMQRSPEMYADYLEERR